MLNAGHRRGAMAGRCVVRGKVIETEELPAFCAVALAGLGAFSTAREEGNKVFGALVKEGEAIRSRVRKAAVAGVKETTAKAAGTRRKLAQVLEDSVARSLKRFGVPTRKDVDALSKRVGALGALIDNKTAGVSRKPAAAKRAASGRR